MSPLLSKNFFLLADDLLKRDDGCLKGLDLGLECLDCDILLVNLSSRLNSIGLKLIFKFGNSCVLGDPHLYEKRKMVSISLNNASPNIIPNMWCTSWFLWIISRAVTDLVAMRHPHKT